MFPKGQQNGLQRSDLVRVPSAVWDFHSSTSCVMRSTSSLQFSSFDGAFEAQYCLVSRTCQRRTAGRSCQDLQRNESLGTGFCSICWFHTGAAREGVCRSTASLPSIASFLFNFNSGASNWSLQCLILPLNCGLNPPSPQCLCTVASSRKQKLERAKQVNPGARPTCPLDIVR